jgi:hypothetical protein
MTGSRAWSNSHPDLTEADLLQEAQNRVFGNGGQPNRGPDRAAFNQGRDNRDALFCG